MHYLKYIVLIALFVIEYSVSVSFINKCKSNDPACYKQSANVALPVIAVGIPEYGVNPMDPLLMKEIDISSPNLKLILYDVTMTGFKNTKILNIKHDKANSKLFFKYVANLELHGRYEMNGNLLFLSLEGKGPLHVTIKKMEVSINAAIKEVIGKDGATHWQLKLLSSSYAMKDNSIVVFEKLLDSNPVLAAAAKEVIAASGNDIITEVGSPVVDYVIGHVITETNHLFEAMPMSELSLD